MADIPDAADLAETVRDALAQGLADPLIQAQRQIFVQRRVTG